MIIIIIELYTKIVKFMALGSGVLAQGWGANDYNVKCSRARFKTPSIFPFDDSHVFFSRSLNPDTRRFAGIIDMPLKLPRSTTAVYLAVSLCRHEKYAAILTIILHDFKSMTVKYLFT